VLVDDMTFRTVLAASAARDAGFLATADGLLALARGFAFDALDAEYSRFRLLQAAKDAPTANGDKCLL
jgi:hypothetical protein